MKIFSYTIHILILKLLTVLPINAKMPVECYNVQLVRDGLKTPLAVDFIDDQHMLIAEQMGIVYLFNFNENTSEVFLNLTDRILITNAARDERGLLGLTLDPDFKTNGILYVFYSSRSRNPQADHDSVISSFQMKWKSGTKVNGMQSIETEILRIEQPKSRQNGGQLFFSDDGYLYITTGDGGDLKNNRFSKHSLLGKILRINVRSKSKHRNYTIPHDNPFINEMDARAEIYAYGFHNPWRCTVDRKRMHQMVPNSTQIFCGDNGEPDRNEEDLYLIERGGRYGWLDDPMAPCKTLKTCQSKAHLLPANFHLPIHSYSHEEGQAVIGGIVYRGRQFPELQGHFIFADYVHGTFHTLKNVPDKWITGNMCVQYPSGCRTDSRSTKCPHVLGIVTNLEGKIIILTKTKMFQGKSEGKIYKFLAPYNSNCKTTFLLFLHSFLYTVQWTLVKLDRG